MELLRLDEANREIVAIDDPAQREVVRYSLGLLVGKFVAWDGAPAADRPAAPFDAAFYVRCIRQLFGRPDRITRMLANEVVDDIATLDLSGPSP
jgi:hypothetical protein